MSRIFVKLSTSGKRIAASATAPDAWSGDVADFGDGFSEVTLPPGVSGNLEAVWWDGSGWQQRQALPEPQITSPVGERHLAWSGLPAGTAATVIDTQTAQVLGSEAENGGALLVELHEPGGYRVEVTPPDEWLPVTIEVTL